MSVETTEAASADALVLAVPSPELAAKLFAEVSYEQSLAGLKMSKMGGSSPSTLSSLPEVEHFLQISDYDEVLNSQQATVGYIAPAALATWIEQVLGDDELAVAIRKASDGAENYGLAVAPMKRALRSRLLQARAVLEAAEQK